MRTKVAPLAGVTVIDLTQVVSGAVSTMMLADFGATVIKVEPPGGEAYRRFGKAVSGADGTTNVNVLRWSRGKQSVVIDLKTDEGKALLWGLIDRADVLVENFRPGKLEELGFSARGLAERNPRLVYTSVSGFGHDDLYKSAAPALPVYAIIAEAMAGVTYLSADREGEPVWMGFAMADILAGLLAFSGTLLALRQRDEDGRDAPLRVDISMQDSAMLMNEQAVLRYALSGEVEPPGKRYSLQSPWGLYPAADGHYALAVMTPSQWTGLCAAIGRRDLAERDDLRLGTERSAVHDELILPALRDWAAARSKHEVAAILAEAGVPCAPVNHAGDVFADPQVDAREMLVTVEDDVIGPIRQVGNPIKLAGTPDSGVLPRIPALGADTHAVLTEVLDLPEGQVADLVARGVVAVR